jgi:hypothetical protein
MEVSMFQVKIAEPYTQHVPISARTAKRARTLRNMVSRHTTGPHKYTILFSHVELPLIDQNRNISLLL